MKPKGDEGSNKTGEEKGLAAGYCQQTNAGNSIGSPGIMYMYPPWQYGAAAQYVPVHLQQQQQQHKGYGNQNVNHGGYNRQIDCWICEEITDPIIATKNINLIRIKFNKNARRTTKKYFTEK